MNTNNTVIQKKSETIKCFYHIFHKTHPILIKYIGV